MTDETIVTKADREAAFSYYLYTRSLKPGDYRACDWRIRLDRGERDGDEIVQAFARHRLAHSRPSQASDAGELREAAQAVLDNADREGSRMCFEGGPNGEDIWIDHKEVDQPVLDRLAKALATLTAPPTSELVDAKQADTLHSAYIASLDSLTLPTSGERMLREALAEAKLTLEHARTFITNRERMHSDGVVLFDEALAKVRAAIGATP